MRKNELIELLSKLEGNPEIKLWNGLVGDWMDIKVELEPNNLVRMTKEYYLETCRMQDCNDKKDWSYQLPPEEIKELSKNWSKVCEWENNEWVTEEDIKKKRYSSKKIFYVIGKLRGETYSDRLGDISY